MVGLIFWALTHTTRREEASFCFEDFSPPCFFYYTSTMLCDKYFCFRNIFVCVVEFNVLEIKFICFQKLVYLLEICKNLTLLEILETLCNRGTYRREKERDGHVQLPWKLTHALLVCCSQRQAKMMGIYRCKWGRLESDEVITFER